MTSGVSSRRLSYRLSTPARRKLHEQTFDGKENRIGSVVCFVGEAGVGKIRTAKEVAGWATHRGFEVLLGRIRASVRAGVG
jgi:hypothetical protein